MLDVLRRNGEMYPLLTNSALVMSLGSLGKSMPAIRNNRLTSTQPIVEAATVLNLDSSTEIIDVSRLCQKPAPRVQYVKIADSCGRLYSVDRHVSASCWLKIVTIAKDCQSYNVLLMSTDQGVVLKTMKNITPGEPLVMWFTENILAMLNMPYLTNINIKGDNQYICHVCNNHFEHPNPLKIHLALKCNRLDSNYLWAQLAKEFTSIPRPTLSMGYFQSPFNFELKIPPGAPSTRSSPILIDTNVHVPDKLNNSLSFSSNSSTSSNQPSPASSNQPSPTSPGPMSYCSSSSSTTQVSPVKKIVGLQHSAFKPYMTKPPGFSPAILPAIENAPAHTPTPHYHVPTPVPSVPMTTPTPDLVTRAAHMETIVSNLGKSKQGHQCLYCGKLYSRKYGLKIHIRTHTGYKPLKCKYCLRPFGDPSNLNKHVRLHAEGGENPYKCELCGKVLVRRRDLERHIRSRHQENADHISDVSSDGMDV